MKRLEVSCMDKFLDLFRGSVNPTVRVEKRFSALRLLIAVAIALFIAFLLMCTVSENPGKDFVTLLVGPLTSKSRTISIFNKLIPLLFTGTAVCLVFSCGQITTACEGAFYFGAVAATVVAVIPGIPAFLHIPLCLLVAAIAGAVIVMIPTWFNVRYGVLTIVVALLVTNVFVFLGQYLVANPLRDPTAGFEASYPFAESAVIPTIGIRHIHLGLIIGLVLVILGYYLLYHTPFGVEIRTVGNNQKFSQYSGINISRTAIVTSLLAGGMAAMGGATEILANYPRFVFTGTTNHGWNGIVIAVLCKNNPKFVPVAAFFLAYLSAAADALNAASKIPPEIINIIQPIIIIFVAATQLLSFWEHRAIVKASEKMLKEEK